MTLSLSDTSGGGKTGMKDKMQTGKHLIHISHFQKSGSTSSVAAVLDAEINYVCTVAAKKETAKLVRVNQKHVQVFYLCFSSVIEWHTLKNKSLGCEFKY